MIFSVAVFLSALVLLSASLYVSKRGAYWDRLCRDVVGRWLVGWLVGRWSLVGWLSRACTVAKRCILGLFYYGTLIGNPTPGIQWYNFRHPGVTPNQRMGPREALFVKLLWPLVPYMKPFSKHGAGLRIMCPKQDNVCLLTTSNNYCFTLTFSTIHLFFFFSQSTWPSGFVWVRSFQKLTSSAFAISSSLSSSSSSSYLFRLKLHNGNKIIWQATRKASAHRAGGLL